MQRLFLHGVIQTTMKKLFKFTTKILLGATQKTAKTALDTTVSLGKHTGKYAGKYIKNKLESPSNRYGQTHFMTDQEMIDSKLLDSNFSGICLNSPKYTLNLKKSYSNLLISSFSGGGKSSRVIIPSILNQMDRYASIIVTDVSSELYKATAGYGKLRGYSIQRIDFSSPETSIFYNPLHFATTDREIGNLANILISSALPDTGDNAFWNQSSASLIEILIKLLKSIDEPQYTNLANVRWLINNFGDGSILLPLFQNPKVLQTLYSEFLGILQTHPKVLQTILSNARTALRVFTDQKLCALTSKNELDIESLRTKKSILYITAKETDIPHLKFFINCLYQQLFDFFTKNFTSSSRDVFCYMDEFPAMGIKNMDSILSITRKYRIACILVCQSTSQLHALYGRDRANTLIKGAIASRLYLGGLDYDTAEEISKQLGTHTYEDIDPWTQNKSNPYPRDLMLTQEVQRLKSDEAIFVHGAYLPVKLKNFRGYYEDKELSRRAAIKPPPLYSNQLPSVPLIPLPDLSKPQVPPKDSPPNISFDL